MTGAHRNDRIPSSMHGGYLEQLTVSDMLASHYDPAHGDRPGGGLGIQSGSTNHAICSPLEHQLLLTLSISITVNGISY